MFRGVAEVWPTLTYHSLATTEVAVPRGELIDQGPKIVEAESLWGPSLDTAGNGMKIGIIDDGIEASHPYFYAAGMSYPPGFPKGLTRGDDAQGDRRTHLPSAGRRATATPRRPSIPRRKARSTPPTSAGIAAGDYDTRRR